MNRIEFEEVHIVMRGLWPKQTDDMTTEILGTWRRICEGHNPPTVITALRAWAESSRYCPHPSEIRERLQARTSTPEDIGPRKATSSQQVQREVWAKRDPANAIVYRNLSDNEVDLRCLAWEFEQSSAMYGADSLATVRAWQQWQAKAYDMGQRSGLVQTPHHTEAARIQYQADPTGQANAQRIRDARRTARMEDAA